MQTAGSEVASKDLAETIRLRIIQLWEAYKRGAAEEHNAILADDYQAIHSDGSLHPRKPTAQEIVAQPMSNYSLTELRVFPLGPDVVLTNYLAAVEGPSGNTVAHAKFRVGQVWVKQSGKWKCRSFQATTVK